MNERMSHGDYFHIRHNRLRQDSGQKKREQ
jgi:hypothetical protein